MKFADIMASCKSLVRQRNGSLVEQAVEAMVDQELKDRSKIIQRGVEAYREMEKALSSIRAKSPGFSADGSEIAPVFTREQMKQKRETETRLAALDNALAKAVEDCDYGPLLRLVEKSAPEVKT